MGSRQGGWDGQEGDEGQSRRDDGPTAGGAEDLLERWSAQRKTELVLRLLRGEPLDAVSRESQVPAHELEGWKGVFLEAGGRGLKSRSDAEERELTLARAKVWNHHGPAIGVVPPLVASGLSTPHEAELTGHPLELPTRWR